MKKLLILIPMLLFSVSCSAKDANTQAQTSTVVQTKQQTANYQTAVFAGGCFWCMEKPYDELNGVISTTSGYIGGSAENANYSAVSSGTSKHYEAIEVRYDSNKVSYQQLLDIFWKNIDPFDAQGQFCDKGHQYRAAIFPNTKAQAQLAKQSLQDKQTQFKERKIVTQIVPASTFYAAEAYHQDYYLRNPLRYKYYRYSCGRDARLAAVWGEK